MITYKANPDESQTVYLEKKVVGEIRCFREQGQRPRFQYFPKGQPSGGWQFTSLIDCKRDIEGV